MHRKAISAAEARRIALASQGLDRADDPATIDVRHVTRELRRIGVLQLDFVNVLIPAHYLVLYSRLGPYAPATLERSVYDRGAFIEQWAHEASIVPVEAWPLLHYRRKAWQPWPNSPIMKLPNRDKYLSECIEIVKEKGPVTANDMPPADGPARKPGDWHRSVPRWALEYHFGIGNVVACHRRSNFQRVYDLPERVIGERWLELRPGDDDARRELLRIAARAMGIATTADLADYFRMTRSEALPRLQELAEEGDLRSIDVEGWTEPGWLHSDARLPRNVTRRTLLSPFDPLVWFRPRAERLFDFHYRIEIYVPAHKRRWGYYVLPFLLDDALAARVDLKANRKDRVLEVPAAYLEGDANEKDTAAALGDELRRLARWLELDTIRVGRRGDLSRALRQSVSASCT